MLDALLGRPAAALERGLAHASRRHDVLTENLANAATPNYRARDVVFDDVLSEARVVEAKDGPPGADGNDVSSDRQVARMTENLLFHSALVATLANRLNVMKQAISGRV
jgi:flagellar basal-body rod protein FlgB